MTVIVGGIPLDILKQKKTPKKLNQVFFKLQQKNNVDGDEVGNEDENDVDNDNETKQEKKNNNNDIAKFRQGIIKGKVQFQDLRNDNKSINRDYILKNIRDKSNVVFAKEKTKKNENVNANVNGNGNNVVNVDVDISTNVNPLQELENNVVDNSFATSLEGDEPQNISQKTNKKLTIRKTTNKQKIIKKDDDGDKDEVEERDVEEVDVGEIKNSKKEEVEDDDEDTKKEVIELKEGEIQIIEFKKTNAKGKDKPQKIMLGDYVADDDFKIKGKKLNKILPKKPIFELKTHAFFMNNRKKFYEGLAQMFDTYDKEAKKNEPITCDTIKKESGKFEPLLHQKIVRDYLSNATPFRGLLLCHMLGSGKTCTSIAIAEANKSEKLVITLQPASLTTNLFAELKKCGDPIYKIRQYWVFISLDGKDKEYIEKLSLAVSIDSQFLQNQKGIWLADLTKTESNFKDLSPEQQSQINNQIDEQIHSKYLDINYNNPQGLSSYALMTENFTRNIFDNATVIITRHIISFQQLLAN